MCVFLWNCLQQLFFQEISLPPSVTVAALWHSLCLSVEQIITQSLTVVPHRTILLFSCGSACPRNKVVPTNCSNGVLSSLDSWPWLCVIRVGQRGLEVGPWGLFHSPSHQLISQTPFTPQENLHYCAILNWAAFELAFHHSPIKSSFACQYHLCLAFLTIVFVLCPILGLAICFLNAEEYIFPIYDSFFFLSDIITTMWLHHYPGIVKRNVIRVAAWKHHTYCTYVCNTMVEFKHFLFKSHSDDTIITYCHARCGHPL